MKKKQLKKIFQKEIKRNNTITKYITAIVIILTIFLSTITLYIDHNKIEYIKYSENGNVDYKVYLKKNNFFENKYLEENNQYISTLIDDIEANFKYNISIEQEDVTYKYTYKIVTNVKVTDKTTKKDLYNKTETLVPEKEEITQKKEINITEQVKIDYNKYNDLINSFINIYEVGNIESDLTVNMIINIVGSSDNFKNDKKNESIITLRIPLTASTMAIDTKNNLIDTNYNVIKCQEKSKYNILLLGISLSSIILDIILLIKLLLYIKKTRSPKTKYEKEVKKILRNYRQYIQKIDNKINYEKYEKIKVSTFTDLLEIRDTLQQPILMITEDSNTKFIVPTNSILYIYDIEIKER